jgi:hypothetical protein
MTAPEKTPKTSRKRPRRPAADNEQYERFREFAREVGATEDPDEFDREFRRIVPSDPSKPSQ